MQIGFIGQGFIGKNYADDFEERGFAVVRYALEPEYAGNKDKIAECDIVFIAVPTPTTPAGFDDSAIRSVLPLIGSGKTAIIKSTIVLGTTESLQKEFPTITVMHSPEFLRERHAAYDARHPDRNIIGIVSEGARARAEAALATMAPAAFSTIVDAHTAELIKYAGNCLLMNKVVFMNVLYDLARAQGIAWEPLRNALAHDSRIGESHTEPVHVSGHGGPAGRGAGGHCFIKDFAAFREMYADYVPEDSEGLAMLQAIEQKNRALLTTSGKDIDLLASVYGT